MTPRPDLTRIVGGLRCLDVLELLPDYVDGDLAPASVASVNAHLTGCDHCERFGGRYASTVAALRGAILGEGSFDEGLRTRLQRRLERLWGDEPRDTRTTGDRP